METQKERLKAFITASGYSVRAFENELGLSNGTIAHCTGNLSANLKEKVLARFPQLSQEWLLYGIGDMINRPAGHPESDTGHIRDTYETHTRREKDIPVGACDCKRCTIASEMAEQRKMFMDLLKIKDEQISQLTGMLREAISAKK